MAWRIFLSVGLAAALAAPAEAQLLRRKARDAGPPPGTPPAEAEIWPFPPPDPQTWWDDKRPKTPEAADPLGGRRFKRVEQLARPDNGVDPSTYRLWGLMPLQWQLVRGDELILEVWSRPATSVRQAVVRIVVREDGKAFVQARAGLACCDAGIGRRVGFDEPLPDGAAVTFRGLARNPLWQSPRDVTPEEPGAVDTLCLLGQAYDLTLVTAGRSTSVRRACDPAEVGEAADVLEAVFAAAIGHEPRFDVLFRNGAGFASARKAHAELIAGGGRLKAKPLGASPRMPSGERPGQEGAPQLEAVTPPSPPPPPAARP